jgi:hypothetical protein
MTSVLEIESQINNFLQRSIIFKIENKVLKKGKLILFCIKDFFCVFTLLSEEKNNKKIVFEIPYPYDILRNKNSVIFDYSINSFTKGNKELTDLVSKVKTKKASKFYDRKLTLYTV